VIEHKERSEKLLIASVGSCWTFSESFQKRLDERRNVCIQYTVISGCPTFRKEEKRI
jgi:hypothetical protein